MDKVQITPPAPDGADKALARKLIESIFANRGWTNDELINAICGFAAQARKEGAQAQLQASAAYIAEGEPMTQPNETQRPQISVCKACSAASSGWLSCPHCGAEDWEDVGAYVLTDTRAPVDSQGAETLPRASVAAPPPDIPTNWLDPLLSGSDAVIGKPPYDCADIERLLNAIRNRIASSVAATETKVANERPYCAHCRNKGWLDGLEVPCRWCNPGGEFRSLGFGKTKPSAPVPSDSSIRAVAAEIAGLELADMNRVAAILSKHLGSAAVPQLDKVSSQSLAPEIAKALNEDFGELYEDVDAAAPTSTEDAAGGGGRST